jgi:hypothetical protein
MKDNQRIHPSKLKSSETKTSLTNDKCIRLVLKQQLLAESMSDPKSIVVEELGVMSGDARIDIAVVNGMLHGYEIKSDRDSLIRLPNQIAAYSSVFSQVTIVTGKHHLANVISIVPEWWGIMVARSSMDRIVTLHEIRECLQNPAQDSIAVARLLYRDEAIEILRDMNKSKGFISKSRDIVYGHLASVVDHQTLHEKVRTALLTRAKQRAV